MDHTPISNTGCTFFMSLLRNELSWLQCVMVFISHAHMRDLPI